VQAHDARVPLGTAAIATAYRRSNKLTKARQSGEMLPIPRASTETPPQTHRHVASKSGETLTRAFIGDMLMQRFDMVDIQPTTTAKQVLANTVAA
jgi:hypothetical protein